MANTKGQGIRQKIIDQCLRSERGYSTAEMMERCNKALELRGYLPISSENTLRSDIDEICNEYDVEIETVKNGRNKRYRYIDREFSIYKMPLTNDQKEHLKELMETISIYEGRPQLEWLPEINEHLQSILELDVIENERIVGFDVNKNLVGMENFRPLLDFIRKKKAVTIAYRSFRKPEGEQVIFHPYYLKQYNNRWFVFGEKDDRSDLTNYALDRIVSLSESEVQYRPNNGKYDFSKYFEDMIGVSRKDGVSETVRLLASASRYPYIKTKPLHTSQKEVCVNGDGSVEIELKVVLNPELESWLLYYGPDLKVLAPEGLKSKIREKIEKNLKIYE